MARALGNKIAAKQAEARRRSPARPAPPPGAAGPVASGSSYGALAQAGQPPQPQAVQMAQGDSWYNSGILANPLAAQQR